MSSRPRLLEIVLRLCEEGSLPRSSLSTTALEFLRPLMDSGVVAEERVGAGKQYRVRDAAALESFVAAQFPASAPSPFGTRADGVARFRDSKTLRNDTPEVVLARAWGECPLRRAGKETRVAQATAEEGVFAFLLRAGDAEYTLDCKCALVENPAVFLQFERIGCRVPMVIHANGRISSRLLDWFASQQHGGFSLIHFPDYDPAGLSEFERLRLRLGPGVTLYRPDNLAELFARYSNRRLLQMEASRSMLRRLRLSRIPEVAGVVELIDRYNGGLEQEVFMSAGPGGPAPCSP